MRRSLGALSDVTEDDEHQSSSAAATSSNNEPAARRTRQSVASQFSDVSELQDILADARVEKFKARSPPPAPPIKTSTIPRPAVRPAKMKR